MRQGFEVADTVFTALYTVELGLSLFIHWCPPPPRTKWTRRVPHPVLIGHAGSLTPY